MNLVHEEISEQQKELCAIVVMRSMLEDFSSLRNIEFDDALLQFAKSKTYNALFDFTTGLWREGPDYLRGFFEEELSRQNHASP